MKLTINEKEYELKYTLRAVMAFERITGKMFSLATMTDQYMFFYAVLIACNEDMKMTFSELISAMDKDANIFLKFSEFIMKEIANEDASESPKSEEAAKE